MAVSSSKDGTLRLWQFNWEPDIREDAFWDEEVRPYLEIFLTLHSPYPTGKLVRIGKPQWNEDHLHALLKDLANRGFGWITPEGIQSKLMETGQENVRSPPGYGKPSGKSAMGRPLVFMPFKYLKKPLKFLTKLIPPTALGLLFWKMGFWEGSYIQVFIASVLVAFILFVMISKPRKR